ncbi:MAG: hypothetical protein E6Q97_36100 [Desulfurellales bacterium]|nr:MAG: hypothetical protein E6Q97_36100 [Desulfurellales bacterium]
MGAQHFFVEGKYLGCRQIPNMRLVPGLEVRPHFSYAYFCGRCGEIWGRILHDKAQWTQVEYRPCRKHGDGRLSAHPDWTDRPDRAEEDWPPEALTYEFSSTVTYYERQQDATQ